MNKLQNANLPASIDPPGSYQRNLNVKLNELFRNIKDLVNRHQDGYLFPSYTTTVDYTPTLNDCLILADATSGEVEVTFPPADQWKDKLYIVKKIDASGNTVAGVGTSEGAAKWTTTTRYGFQRFMSDGDNIWKV